MPAPALDPAPTLTASRLTRELTAGLIVFFVALPLCLGIAMVAGAPPIAGLISGVIGGIVVGLLSGAQICVSGPAAGLAAVAASQIAYLGYETFLLALVLAGLMQVALGLARAGSIAAFFPTSVIKGLLTAIGVILVLKQIPHLLGRDGAPEGGLGFYQLDRLNTFSEIGALTQGIHPGAATIGLVSLVGLIVLQRVNPQRSNVAGPLGVVVLGVLLSLVFSAVGGAWALQPAHLIQVPVVHGLHGWSDAFHFPDWTAWSSRSLWLAALTIAAVASLESLLNSEAVDKLDPLRRIAPRSRELLAQGAGNTLCGLVGGMPIAVVIARSSVAINAGGRTRLTTIVHGLLILLSVVLLPTWINRIPLASLAAILLITGARLASPSVVRKMWGEGYTQFIPFATTVAAIVLTDLLPGILIGMAVSVALILRSNMRRPVRRYVEKHLGGDVLHVELANQVSFLNRGAIERVLDQVPSGGNVLLDATHTDYIDPDVLTLLRDFAEQTGPARGIAVSLRGFRSRYNLDDSIQYVDFSTREVQDGLTPEQVLRILIDGNQRFLSGRTLTRDLGRVVKTTAEGQHPLAVVLSCMDSRAPVEILFDLGLGEIFSIRIAGNVSGAKVLGGIEYATAAVGAKLVLVMGHTRCGAVGGAVKAAIAEVANPGQVPDPTGGDLPHFGPIAVEIQKAIDPERCRSMVGCEGDQLQAFVDEVARRNVFHTIDSMLAASPSLARLVREGRVAVAGALYDVTTGAVEFLTGPDPTPASDPRASFAANNHLATANVS
jgi:carbonic anhydrase/SulP family sulfate permease